MTARGIIEPCQRPQRVGAKSLFCLWAGIEAGLDGTVVGKRLGLVQSAVGLLLAIELAVLEGAQLPYQDAVFF